jgi:hypothetical protein
MDVIVWLYILGGSGVPGGGCFWVGGVWSVGVGGGVGGDRCEWGVCGSVVGPCSWVLGLVELVRCGWAVEVGWCVACVWGVLLLCAWCGVGAGVVFGRFGLVRVTPWVGSLRGWGHAVGCGSLRGWFQSEGGLVFSVGGGLCGW